MKATAEINTQLKSILSPVATELSHIERILYKSILPDDRQVREPFLYLDTMKGKLLRPALVFLTAKAFGEINDLHRSLAQCVELVHVASLTHDDVVDHSPLRRGKQSLNSRFGDESALLVGDYLFSKALELMISFNSPEVFVKVAQVISTASIGELRQVNRSFQKDITEEEYLEYIQAKTAGLFAMATELSAYASGVDPVVQKGLSEFGMNFGMAFQVVDDCSDLFGESVIEGKPVRSDLLEGQFTLPIIRLFKVMGDAWTGKWLLVLEENPKEAERILVKQLLAEDILGYSFETAFEFINRANNALSECEVLSKTSSLPLLGETLVKKLQSLR